MEQASYSFKWDAKERPVVVIDARDGKIGQFTRPDLVAILALIQDKKELFTEANWQSKIDLYQGALDYLDNQLALEQKL